MKTAVVGQIAFYALGSNEIRIENELVGNFISSKVPALLYYLVANPGEHNRKELANKLWSNTPEKVSAANLRNVLSNARKKVGDYIQVNGQLISFDHSADHWFDVSELEHLVERPLNRSTVTHWQQTLDLYRGDFLAGFEPRSAEPYIDWISSHQAVIRAQYMQRIMQLGRYYLETEDYESGLIIANRILLLEPWHEPAYRLSMRLLAGSGQRNAALTQYESCRAMLRKELDVEPESKTKALYNSLLAENRPIPNNLWAETRSCIGRKDEIQYVHKLLQVDDSRLLTIIGSGGVGKTMLSIQVAWNLLKPDVIQSQFRDGVFIVTLSRVTPSRVYNEDIDSSNRNRVAIAIGNELGIEFFSNQSIHTQLLNWLHDKNMLLILNNCEQLLTGSEYIGLVNDILHSAPNVKLLVTSRQRLMIRAERIFVLNGLPTSINDANSDLSEAAKLFIDRGRVNVPDFETTPEDTGAINRICKLSDGLPLAIELAAGWLGTLTCTEIAKELEGGLDLLATELHDMPLRHRDMRAVFDYSWKLLSDEEQQCLLHLSIFRFNFTYAAALTVSSMSLLLIQQLVNKSWLQSTDKYFAFQLLIHEYLREKRLADAVSNQETHLRYSTYYATLLQSILPEMRGRNSKQGLAQISAELDNILSAHTWVVEQQDLTLNEAMVEPLATYFETTGTEFAAAEHFATLAKIANSANHKPLFTLLRAIELSFSHQVMPGKEFLHTVAEISPEIDVALHPATLGMLYCAAAQVSIRQNAIAQAYDYAEKSLEVLGELPEHSLYTVALDTVALSNGILGNFSMARRFARKAVSINRQRQNAYGIATSLAVQGRIAMYDTDFELAYASARESAELFRQMGNIYALPLPLTDRCRALIALERLDEARTVLQECLEAAQLNRIPRHTQLALWCWSLLLIKNNRFDQARVVLASIFAVDSGEGRLSQIVQKQIESMPPKPRPAPLPLDELCALLAAEFETEPKAEKS